MINFPLTTAFKGAFFSHFGERAPQRIPKVITQLIGLPFLSFFSEMEKIQPIECNYPLFDRVKEKLHFTNSITIAENLNRTEAAYGEGHLIVYPGFFELPEPQQAFCIAHELKHHQLGHPQKRFWLELAICLTDLAALYLFIPGILLIELGAFFLENALSRHWEKEADLAAIYALRTKIGALAYFQSQTDHSPYTHPSLAERIQYIKVFDLSG